MEALTIRDKSSAKAAWAPSLASATRHIAIVALCAGLLFAALAFARP